jgi:very-short-patch-repair endonuclease
MSWFGRIGLEIGKMRQASVRCAICDKVWKQASMRMLEGKTCSKTCSSIKGYLSGDRKETGIELKLQELLKELKIEFQTQKPLVGITIADIFVYPNVAIFADGKYWHHSTEAQETKDRTITQKLKKAGYVVLRLEEDEINKDIDSVRKKVTSAYDCRKIEKKL